MMTQVLTRDTLEPATKRAKEATPDGRASGAISLAPQTVETLATIFAALGEPTRLRIVHALSRGELCVSDLAALLAIPVPAVSQHLRVLREVRIVRNRRAGKLIYYALDDAHVSALFEVALEHVRGGEDDGNA